MNIEEYLQSNKDKLTHQVDTDKMWEGINENTLQKINPRFNKTWLFVGICAIVLMSLVGYYRIGYNKEIKQTKTELFTLKTEINNLIQDSKTSSRIRAVNMGNEAANVDQAIITVLIDRMMYDESTNVQLAATRALEKHMNAENVRVAMIETLTNAKDTYLQLKLIDLLSQHKEKRLLPYLDSIIQSNQEKSILTLPAEKAEKILKEL